MNLKKHLLEHIFVISTSIAMVVHSTWTFGTLFAGEQPIVYPNQPSTIIAYIFWVTPALLVAIAIDVGQIQTSIKLATSKRPGQKLALGITFVALALAGFYLQWFHLAHHMPALEFGAGLTPETAASLQGLKELAILIIPALLPLSTVLYTLSLNSEQVDHEEELAAAIQIETPISGPCNGTSPLLDPYWTTGKPPAQLPEETEELNEDDLGLPMIEEDDLGATEPYAPIDANNAHNLVCPDCGWETGPKMRLESAQRSLRTHQARHCSANHAHVE